MLASGWRAREVIDSENTMRFGTAAAKNGSLAGVPRSIPKHEKLTVVKAMRALAAYIRSPSEEHVFPA
jgi:hypothetical protein